LEISSATAITTAAVAVLVAIITWREWVTNRSRLRHELFERRYAVYEQIGAFLAKVLQEGRVPKGEPEQFLRSTKTAYFVFGSDAAVKLFIEEIFSKAAHLHALDATLDSLRGEERSRCIESQMAIKEWFRKELGSLEDRFEKYLSLQH
jgi:hypothetical protein